jgi:hypothetical protein
LSTCGDGIAIKGRERESPPLRIGLMRAAVLVPLPIHGEYRERGDKID